MKRLYVLSVYSGAFYEKPSGVEDGLLHLLKHSSFQTYLFVSKLPTKYTIPNVQFVLDSQFNQMVITTPPDAIVIQRFPAAFMKYILPPEIPTFLYAQDGNTHFVNQYFEGKQLPSSFFNNLNLPVIKSVVGTYKKEIQPKCPGSICTWQTTKNELSLWFQAWPHIEKAVPYAKLQMFTNTKLNQTHHQLVKKMKRVTIDPVLSLEKQYNRTKHIKYCIMPKTNSLNHDQYIEQMKVQETEYHQVSLQKEKMIQKFVDSVVEILLSKEKQSTFTTKSWIDAGKEFDSQL